MLLEDCDMEIGASVESETIFPGHVYDFRLWSRALTAADVAPGLKVRTYVYPWDFSLAGACARGWSCSAPGRLVDANQRFIQLL